MPDHSAEPVPSLGASYLANVPQSVRDNVDRALLDAPNGKLNIAKIHRSFCLKEALGVSLTTFRRYARRLLRNKRLHALARSATADLGPPPDPEDVDRLQDQVQLLVLKNLARALDDAELLPAELCGLTRVFIAYRKVQIESQKLDDDRLPEDDALEPLEQRVQFLILQQLVRALEDDELTSAEVCGLTRVFVAYRKLQLQLQTLAATETPEAGAPPLPGVGDGHLARSSEFIDDDDSEPDSDDSDLDDEDSELDAEDSEKDCDEPGTDDEPDPDLDETEPDCDASDSSPRPPPPPPANWSDG